MAASLSPAKQRRRKGERKKGPNAEENPTTGPKRTVPFLSPQPLLDLIQKVVSVRKQIGACMFPAFGAFSDHPTDRILMGPQSHAARLVWAFGPVSDGPTPKE
ncbi:hypothetical protein HPP92_016082 [Vanilla planifolia]|uniref:Uncharacterized protein n=1 Tax=Vanilla planifolia TaxID=51239 RepID=A0A835UTV6_VANPL|nr:hypothetical protein HPP92_016082 [Vanilla planifolia]